MSCLSHMLKFSPFLATSSYFLYKYHKDNEVDSTYITLKCIPILCLAFFVFANYNQSSNKAYLKRILLGLVLSAIADAVICFQEYFLIAVGIFALVQLNYLTSFGFKPRRLDIALLVFGIELCCCYYLLPFVEDSILKVALTLYVTLLFSMIWRSLSKVKIGKNCLDLPNIFGALGSILFGCSDIILCYHIYAKPIEFGNFFIMITYYYAQAGIAISVISSISTKKAL